MGDEPKKNPRKSEAAKKGWKKLGPTKDSNGGERKETANGKVPAGSASRELTPRQITFTKHLLTGATITEAARKAGYSEKNLAQSGHQALQTIRLKRPELMARLELAPSVIIEKYLVPLLSANKTKFFQHKGKIIESRAVPDHHTRLIALDMVFRLMGAYAAHRSPRASEFGVRVVIEDPPRPLRPVTETSPQLCLPAPQGRREGHPLRNI